MFIIHMATTSTPLVEPATFADRNFVVGATVAIVMGMLQYVPMLLFPPLLQDLRGYPDGIIGLLVAARGLGNFGSFFIVAPLTRISPRFCLFVGFSIQAVAATWMGSLDINLSTSDVMFTNMLHGLGFGLAYTPMAVLTFSTLPGNLLTQGNAVFSLVRMLGSSIFISMTLLVFSHSVAEATANLTSYITVLRIDSLLPWVTTYGSLGDAATYDRLASEVQRQAGMIGYINAFHLMTLITICASPLAFLFAPRGAAR
jgi:DHA2 family multidrug resistance protein